MPLPVLDEQPSPPPQALDHSYTDRRVSLLMSSESEPSSSSDSVDSSLLSSSTEVKHPHESSSPPSAPVTVAASSSTLQPDESVRVPTPPVHTVDDDAVVSGIPHFDPNVADSSSESEEAPQKPSKEIELVENAVVVKKSKSKSKKKEKEVSKSRSKVCIA